MYSQTSASRNYNYFGCFSMIPSHSLRIVLGASYHNIFSHIMPHSDTTPEWIESNKLHLYYSVNLLLFHCFGVCWCCCCALCLLRGAVNCVNSRNNDIIMLFFSLHLSLNKRCIRRSWFRSFRKWETTHHHYHNAPSAARADMAVKYIRSITYAYVGGLQNSGEKETRWWVCVQPSIRAIDDAWRSADWDLLALMTWSAGQT